MGSGARARARTSFSHFTHRPPIGPWQRPACVVLEDFTKRTPHVAPREAARCRHVGHAARIAMPSALQTGRPVRRVVMSPLSRDPPPRLLQTPNAFQLACRGKPVQRRSPEIGRDVVSAPASGSCPEAATRTVTAAATPPTRHQTSPAAPRRISAAIPPTGFAGRKPAHHTRRPVPNPARNPRPSSFFAAASSKCSRTFPPGIPNAVLPAVPSAQHLNACPICCPRQQPGEGHSRTCSKTSITAIQANRMHLRILPGATSLRGQAPAGQAAPEYPVGPISLPP